MPEVTRRSFVEIAVGTLASLPALAGGVLLAPRPAFATDDDTLDSQLAGKESEYVIIDVVAPWEVGFMVVDITNGTERDGGLVSYPPVQGAHVTVTSRFNNKVVEGTTNEKGVVNLDVRELSVHEDGQDVNKLDDYYFNGSITITCEGYREFRTALVEVQGGEGLQVPAHPIDDSGPYPHLASFDEWDALYTKGEFTMTPKNEDEHTISAEMYGLPEASDATFELWVKGEGSPRQSVQASVGESRQVGTQFVSELVTRYINAGGEEVPAGSEWVYKQVPIYGRPAVATFKGRFLKEGHADQIPVGAELQLVVRQQGHDPWRLSLAATAEKGVIDEPSESSDKELTLINPSKGSVGPAGVTNSGVKWPKAIPILGGGDLKFWMPQSLVNISATPTGYIQVTVDIPIWGYRNDKGNDEKSDWGHYPHDSIRKQFDKKYDNMKKMYDNVRSVASKPGKVKQLDLFKSFSVDINFQLLALVKFDKDKNLFQGEVAGQILAALDFTITENFMAGPIPVLITFSLDATLAFALSAATYAAMKKDEMPVVAATDFSRWQFDYQNTGFSMTFNLTPSLSVGVGVRGVASISVKGSITLTLFFGVPMGTQPKELPSPHFAAGWSAEISLVIELFLFTMNITLFPVPFSNFYDNWDGKNLTAQAEEQVLSALANKSLEELLADLVPITDAMLEKTKEASISGVPLTAQQEGLELPVISYSFEGATRTEVVDERTGNTYVVYDWGAGTDEIAKVQPQSPEESDAAPTQDATSPADDASQTAEDAYQSESEPDATTLVQNEDSAEDDAAEVLDDAFPSDYVVVSGAAVHAQAEDVAEDDSVQAVEFASGDAPQPESEDEAKTDHVTSVGPSVFWLSAMAEADLPSPAVASLGAAGGVRPSSDMRLFGSDDKHVLGATRAKVISLGVNQKTGEDGGVWVFRLASVEVAGNMRTRIIGSCIDGPRKGTLRVVEFDTSAVGISHNDLYDYDFDVVGGYECLESAYNWGSARSCFYLQFVVVSGRRPQSPTLAASATDLVFSNVLFLDDFSITYDANQPDYLKEPFEAFKRTADAAFAYYRGHGFFDASSMPLTVSGIGKNVIGQDADKFHSVTSVQIERCIADGNWALDPYTFVVTFLDRCSGTAEATLGDSANVRLGTILFNWVLNGTPSPSMTTLSVDGTGDGTTYEQVLSPYKHESHNIDIGPEHGMDEVFFFVIMLRGANKAHYLNMFVALSDFNGNYNHVVSMGDYDPSIRLVPCAAQSYFLTSYPTDETQLKLPIAERDYTTWTLHKVTCVNASYEDPWEYSAHLEFTPIGPAGFNVVNFAVNPKGTFLFWPHTRDADKDRVWDKEGKEDVRERPAVYQIMACRIRKDRFSDPFVLADLPTDTDALVVVGTTKNAVAEMLRTVYVDTGEKNAEGKPLYHAADVWYTSVPAVRCVTATACEAPHPFVNPGGQITFHVAVRNDGNTYLSGCTLELCVHNESTDAYERVPGAAAQISFGKDTVLESAYNHSDGKGGLTGLEDDYTLAPGKTSVYAVTVTVPSDWPSGDKKVLFVASDGQLAEGLYAQAEDDAQEVVEFHIEPGEFNVVQVRTQVEQSAFQRHMDTIGVDPDGAGGMRFQPVPMGRGEGTADGGATSSGTSRGSSARLADTGDAGTGPGLGLAGVGLTALGAAVAAYERRRAQNERD